MDGNSKFCELRSVNRGRQGLARLGHQSTTRQRHELSVHGQRRQALNAMNVAASSRSESEIDGTPSNMSLEGGPSVLSGGASVISVESVPFPSKPQFRSHPEQSMKRVHTRIPESFTKPNFFSRYEGTQSSASVNLDHRKANKNILRRLEGTELMMVQGDQLLAQ